MKRSYVFLCWTCGAGFLLIGLWLCFAALQSRGPDAAGILPFPLGPQGYYFVAFSGCALVAWGGCLVGAARGHGARAVGTATAVGLVLAAFFRMLFWFLGDMAWVGDVLRAEAAVMLLLALAFVWLRPAHAAEPL